MKLSQFFISRPIFAGVLSALIFLAGLIALPELPISEYPEVVPPTVVVKRPIPAPIPRSSRDLIQIDQLGRLQALIQTLQGSNNFNAQRGEYPTAIQWTSTTLASFIVDYSQLTDDAQYFPNVAQFYKSQPVFSLLTQMYDDKQWVVLTWLRAGTYAKPRNFGQTAQFLSRAKFFYDFLVTGGWNTSSCGGGMKWGPTSGYKNAVTTELFIATSMGMYEAFGTQGYLDNAVKAWIWFKNSGMINGQGLINDGLTDTCQYAPLCLE